MRTFLYRVAWLALLIILLASIFIPIFGTLSDRAGSPRPSPTAELPLLRAERTYPLLPTHERAPALDLGGD